MTLVMYQNGVCRNVVGFCLNRHPFCGSVCDSLALLFLILEHMGVERQIKGKKSDNLHQMEKKHA